MYSQKQSLCEFYHPDHIEHHFDKSFTLSNNAFSASLEEDEFGKLFGHRKWTVDDLQLIEEQLFFVKSKLNNFNLRDWSIQTGKYALLNIHRCYESFDKWPTEEGRQCKPELFTRAWIKLYEILVKFNLKESLVLNRLANGEKQINCLFLCEVPGAFVASLNHYLKQEFPGELRFNWIASSLNPYAEDNDQFHDALTEDCFIEQTFDNWYFGPHNSGDIQQPNFHQSVKEEFQKRLTRDGQWAGESSDESGGVRFSLITADGGMNCMEEPGLQEINSFKLILNEALVALNCLRDGGSLVLKIFGFFDRETISLIYLLACLFERVHLFKPISSKEGNSEIYLVCVDYQLNKNAQLVEQVTRRFERSKRSADAESDVLLFRKEVIPTEFLSQLTECANMFTTHQTNAIDRVIYFNEKDDKKFYYKYKKLQTKVARHFSQLVDLKPIKISDQIVKKRLQLESRKALYFDGIDKKLLMAYGEPGSYAELIRDMHRADKKLASIGQLIASVYSSPKTELFESFNKFHRFDQHSASKALKFEHFVTQLKSSLLSNKSPKYANTKLCCDRLIKVLIDYESVQGAISGAEAKRKMQSNEQAILNQFEALFKSKLDSGSIVSLQNHVPNQDKQSGDLSSILLKAFESSKMPSLSESGVPLVVHLIDLLNLPGELLDDEHCAANHLATQLVKIVDRLQFLDTLIITLPSLRTRYAFGLVYLCSCMFKQFTISPVYLRECRSGSIFAFTNDRQNEPVNLLADLVQSTSDADDQAPDHCTPFDDGGFEEERNQVRSLLQQIDQFNAVHKDEQILDFVGMHKLMSTAESTDFLKFVILANNLNLIETLALRMELGSSRWF